MKFPTRCTYALCMMVEIYRRSLIEEPVRLIDVSKHTGISRNYLEQLSLLLKNHSLLIGVSGRKGGYRLGKAAGEIRILDVVNATIGPIRLTQCVAFPETCMKSDFCACRKYWTLMTAQINALLEDYSLEDLVNEQQSPQLNQKTRMVKSRGEARQIESLLPVEILHEFRYGEIPARTAALSPAPAHVSAEMQDLPCRRDIDEEDYLELLRWLGEELEIKVGDKSAPIPIDKKQAELVYLTNSREVKYMPLSILAAAEIFYAAGQDWTMTSKGWDSAASFGVRLDGEGPGIGSPKVLKDLRALNPGRIILSECGNMVGPSKWTRSGASPVEMEYSVESLLLTMVDYVKSGRIRLDPSRNPGPVTYHDPCILGRYYGITEEPRFLLMKAAENFVEMYPNRSENWCCQGGGGRGMEYNSRREEISRIKIDQLMRTGAKIVATSCPNCIDGLNHLLCEHDVDLKVKSVTELVAEALVYK